MTKKIKPELWIYYSWVYDSCIHEWRRLEYKDFFDKGMKYRDKLQKKWDKVERKVFDTISKVSGLEWLKPIIDCYVVRNVIPFSMPLTISIKNNFDEQVDNIIIHELIHNIVVQNSDKIKRKDYSKKYGKLSKTTKIHILIHAILK